MANQNILTAYAKVSQVDQAYYAPVSVVLGSTNVITSTYCFLSRTDSWANDLAPEVPVDSPAYLKSVCKNMFVAKRIDSSDMSPVIRRNNWTANTIYDYYSDTVNINAKDANGYNVHNFYVNNSYNQVFKCLWNNNGGYSINEPMFQPGAYGINNIYTSADGYKWKYLYSIDTGAQINFMDSSWMPVPIGNNSSDLNDPLLTTPGYGSIDVINVTFGGTGYSATTPPTVTITGDGTGASAFVNLSNGAITDVIMNNPGANYTTATVSVSPTIGTGGSSATIIAPISPVGGHGNDPIAELGCCYIMYTCTFNGSEGGTIPTDVAYRQVGLLTNPVDTTSTTSLSTGTQSIYKISTDLIVAQGAGTYLNDEIIYQVDTSGAVTFSATMLDFMLSTNVISVINITGTPIENLPVFGTTSGCVRTLLNTNPTNFVPQSGYISYIENRPGIQRSNDGIEQFKFVLSF